ncbi:MAG TPA: diaminopimelate decarboxylase [Myxococcales bacterium LLY-WYZ-16_1]|nr:diaminopimelate decarboxylase [Myxococcales bacterium LLY-WYZ-16_1]
MFHFDYDDRGQLCAERVPVSAIADAVGTPTYIYAKATLERHFRVFDEAFQGHPHLVCYAMKANSSLAVLELLAARGAGADIVSGGELRRALHAGIPPEKIVFSGVGKADWELSDGLEARILCFNVESEPELSALEQVARQRNVQAPVSLRVNPDVDAQTHPYIATGLAESKFGIPIEEGLRLAEHIRRSDHLDLVGLDCHIGSQIVTLPPLLAALDSVLQLADRLRAQGHGIHHVDLGGGLGIPYQSESPPHPSELGKSVLDRMKGRPETLVLEPGRVIVGNAGILLSRVIFRKPTQARTFVIVDAAMNDLLRPSLYGAFHDIWPARRAQTDGGREVVDVVGPVCETSDTFAKERSVPRLERGDLVAFMSAGAYGFVMSSNYNARGRPAEVMVDGDRWAVVRERESLDDLMNHERGLDAFGGTEGDAG